MICRNGLFGTVGWVEKLCQRLNKFVECGYAECFHHGVGSILRPWCVIEGHAAVLDVMKEVVGVYVRVLAFALFTSVVGN